jgi:pentatricopeptide repeat protein
VLEWWQAERPWAFGALLWSALIESHCQLGQVDTALAAYQRMRQEGCRPQQLTFVALITALGRHNRLPQAEALFQAMKKEGFPQGEQKRAMPDIPRKTLGARVSMFCGGCVHHSRLDARQSGRVSQPRSRSAVLIMTLQNPVL